jgi:hypothetical protein
MTNNSPAPKADNKRLERASFIGCSLCVMQAVI